MATTVLACVAVALAGRRFRDAPGTLVAARALAAVLVTNEIANRLLEVGTGGNLDWGNDLPLQLSDWALVAVAIALWSPRAPHLFFELAYFWTFTATIQALITPDLGRGPDHWIFWSFFIAHSGTLVAASYLTWGRGMAPRPGAVGRVTIASVIVATLAGVANLLTGGNYMFLREPPARGSLLDLLGPWPWYYASATVLAIVLFTILYRLRFADPPALWRALRTRASGRSS